MTGPLPLSGKRHGTLAAVAFLVGLAAFLPARMFEGRLNQALAPPWHLSVSGTVWGGSGALQSAAAPGSPAVAFTWHFDPLALVRFRATWDLVATSPLLSGPVTIGAGFQSVEFRHAALSIDAAMLQQLIPVTALLAPSGNFFVSTQEAERVVIGYAADFRVKGEAHVKAENLGLQPFGPGPLGTYQLKFTGRDTVIDYAISQSSGALKLDGGGSIQTASPRQLVFSGFVAPSPALPDSLLSQIKAAGQPTADGRLRVDWTSRW